MTAGKDTAFFALLSGVVIMLFCVSLTIGRFPVPLRETLGILASRFAAVESTWTPQMENVILKVRLPRLFGAVLVGGALSISGAAYQSVFRNPLVSPDLLGVSSGACVGASAAILLRFSAFGVQASALFAGLAAVTFTTMIPRFFKNTSSMALVLSGVIVSGFMTSIQGIFKYIADPYNDLPSIVYWALGSLGPVKTKDILTVGPVIVLAASALTAIRWRLNLLTLGDLEAASLGVNVKKLRTSVVTCATLLTASAVCISGTIGWIGLVIPHLGRLTAGNDNKRLIPVSALLGAAFTILVDTIARSLTGSEIPLSILTGVIGTPLFVWLLFAQRTAL